MKKLMIFMVALAALLLTGSAIAGSGSGDLKVGYTYLDQDGNQSMNHSTFNVYEGAALSLEGFRYRFDNGIVARADLRNIVRNDRNLNASLFKRGIFDLRLSHDKFRRVYSFDGDKFTRRQTTKGQLSVRPIEYIEIYGGGGFMQRTGNTVDLFNPTSTPEPTEVDYKRNFYNAGVSFSHENSMVRVEYRGAKFTDDLDPMRDQKRFEFRSDAYITIPNYEFLHVLGGFRRYVTEEDATGFGIRSNRGWGGGLVELPHNFSVKYIGMLDRTASDSDFVATDNMSHAGYVSYNDPRLWGATVGYQFDVNDDFEDEIRANSFYVSAWVKPHPYWEIRGEDGQRSEDIEDGVRLVGEEKRQRFSGQVRFRKPDVGTFRVKWDGSIRKNEDIGSKVDRNRVSVDGSLTLEKYGWLTAGYAYGMGKYENAEGIFEFNDHLVYGDFTTIEYRDKVTLSAGAQYYRSKEDLDVEHFNVKCSIVYRIYENIKFEVKYSAFNFDDLLYFDNQYYTANIVEVNLIDAFSF